MRINEKGQITIPRPLREKYGLTPDADVEFVDTGEGVVLRKTKEARRENVRAWIERARGITKDGMSTDEIMRMTWGDG